MFDRRWVRGLFPFCLGIALVGCAKSGLDSIQVTPSSQGAAVGQTAQFTAIGTFGSGSHPTTQNVTNQVTWATSNPAVATVSSSGVATAVSEGTAIITATATAFNGTINSSGSFTVAGQVANDLLSLEILPSSITVGNLQDTGQFLAIGTFSTPPTTRDLTNSPSLTWISSVPSVFPVENSNGGTGGAPGGIVSAYGYGSAVITAEAVGSDGSVQTAEANFNCPLVEPDLPSTPGSCFPGSQAASLIATLTIYNLGLNTTDWEVTAPSATGTPNVIHCGPGWTLNGGTGGSVCTASYPVNSTVTLTSPAGAGNFGGWSDNCSNSGITAAGPNSCTVTLQTNDTVGVIVN